MCTSHPRGDRTFSSLSSEGKPFFLHAVRETENRLSEDNAYRGTLGLWIRRTEAFPESIEAASLLTLLTRSTRRVAEHALRRAYSVPYVPFQNREDDNLAQPASHVVVGRRAVPRLKRALLALTHVTHGEVYVFLDDFHLVSSEEQPRVIHLIHGALKGASGWLKVAGLRSLLNHYSSSLGKAAGSR